MSVEPKTAEELQPGTVLPTHGRTMNEQKAWFIEKARKNREAALVAQAAEAKKAAAEANAAAKKADKGTTMVVLDSFNQSDAAARHLSSSAVDVSDSSSRTGPAEVTGTADDLSDGLRDLSLAGGDVNALAALAAGESASTELGLALKGLGFKGLQTRKRLEADLRVYHAAQTPS